MDGNMEWTHTLGARVGVEMLGRSVAVVGGGGGGRRRRLLL